MKNPFLPTPKKNGERNYKAALYNSAIQTLFHGLDQTRIAMEADAIAEQHYSMHNIIAERRWHDL